MGIMDWFIILSPFIFIALVTFLVMWLVNKNGGSIWKKKKVFNLIVSSQIYSISEISKLSANTDWERTGQVSLLGNTEFLRGARLDLKKMEIILFNDSSVESIKSEWACLYCRSKNAGETFNCDGCGARR